MMDGVQAKKLNPGVKSILIKKMGENRKKHKNIKNIPSNYR